MRTLLFVVLFWWAPLLAETIEVRLEPFPPLVTESGGGLTVALLNRVAARSELDFNIEIVPYSRAKYQLRNGQADLIGHTPVGYESDEFYDYAQELDWKLPTAADVFAMEPVWLDLPGGNPDFYVGAPLGNAEFFSEITGVPLDRFVESTLPNLVQMLARGRIQALIFERASTRSYIWEARLEGVHYRMINRIDAGLAVRQGPAGDRLRARLEALIREVNTRELLADYLPLVEEHARAGRLVNCPPTDVTSASPRVCPQE